MTTSREHLCDGKDCIAHAGGHHTEACIVRDSEGIAVAHDVIHCECDPTRKYLVMPEYIRGEYTPDRKVLKNPFVVESTGEWTVGFRTSRRARRDSEPLWWTGQGFKDLACVRLFAETFRTREEAEAKIRDELIAFITKWRPDDTDDVRGW